MLLCCTVFSHSRTSSFALFLSNLDALDIAMDSQVLQLELDALLMEKGRTEFYSIFYHTFWQNTFNRKCSEDFDHLWSHRIVDREYLSHMQRGGQAVDQAYTREDVGCHLCVCLHMSPQIRTVLRFLSITKLDSVSLTDQFSPQVGLWTCGQQERKKWQIKEHGGANISLFICVISMAACGDLATIKTPCGFYR